MSRPTSETIARLRAANPEPVEPDLGRDALAQATLQRILSEPAPAPQRTGRRIRLRLPRSGLGVAIAVLCLGGGAAVAATNPFGWWSSNPNSAKYAVDTSDHVRTPTERQVACHAGRGGFVCRPGGSGQRYMFIDSVRLVRLSGITRAGFTKAIALGQAKHRLTSAEAAIIRADLAAVPDSFFPELRLAMHYGTFGGTFGGANGRVPPAGVPDFLVCRASGDTLSCQDLNGDAHAPVGAGIYEAEPAPDWRPAPHTSPSYALPPGVSFTPAEYQLLIDLGRFGGYAASGGPGRAKGVRVAKASGK